MKCSFFCESTGFPSLGVEYLISVLRGQGYEVDTVFDKVAYKTWATFQSLSDKDSSIVDEILETNCKVLFAYSTTINFKRLVHIFDLVKKKASDIITCIGGPHPTYAHEPAIRHDSIDYLCRGEGEIAILELMDLLQGRRNDLPTGIYRLKGETLEGSGFGSLVEDLNTLPYPDKFDFFVNLPNVRSSYSVATSRGCYYNCSFCNSPTMRQNYRNEGFQFLRRRRVEDVIGELKLAKEKYKPKFVWFVDDTFIFDKKYMAEFARQYKDHIGIPFGCTTIPDFFHEDIIDALVEAGLSNVEVGIQSLNSETRLNVFARRETNEQFGRFVHILRGRGVYVHTDHIINPWDTRENLKEQIRTYSEIRPSFINVFHLEYFPDTRVIDEALQAGFLDDSAVEAIGNGDFTTLSTFFGGSSPEVMKTQHDLIILLPFVPFLPTSWSQWLVDSPLLKIFKILPSQLTLLLRVVSILFRKEDVSGRSQLKILLLSSLKINKAKIIPAEGQVKAIREIASYKAFKVLVPARPRS